MHDEPLEKAKEKLEVKIKPKFGISTSPQYYTLLNLFQTHKVGKICQKLTLISITLIPKSEYMAFMQSLIFNFIQKYLPLYSEIDTKTQLRIQALETLVSLSQQKESVSKQFIHQAYNKIQQYRLQNLHYIEALLRLCQILSRQSDKIYEQLVKKCCRIFINLNTTIINSNIFPHLFQFSTTFDPLMIDLKGKNQYCNFKLQQKFTTDPQLKTRLITSHQQILRFINQDQIKVTSENLFQNQNTPHTITHLNFNNELNKTKNFNFFQDNQTMEIKSCFKIKMRESRRFIQSVDEPKDNRESSSEQIVKNFRKKKMQHRLNTSVDSKDQQPTKLQRATISTENYHELHQKSIRNNQRYMNISKRLNFRAINLQPLQNINPTSSLSSGNLVPINFGEKEKIQTQNRNIFNLKRKNHRKQRYHHSQTDKSFEGDTKEFSDFDSRQKTETFSKKMSISLSNKLPYALPKRTFRRFESDDDPSQGISDESSAQMSRSEFNRLKKRSKTREKTQPIIDESQILKYRKRRISEIEEESNRQFSRNNTPQVEDLEKEMVKLRKNHQKEDEQMLGSTTNIESKSQEVQEYEYRGEMRKGYSQNGKTQQSALEKQLMSGPQNELPFQANSASYFTQKQNQTSFNQSGQSHNASLLKIQEPKPESKPDQNKVRRKIILKASKVQFEELPKYLQNFGYLDYDDLFKQISVHQHYICEFYLNETLFNVIVFSPSLDFNNIQIKLIHEVQYPELELFKSVQIKEKFKKVVLKNFIQIVEKSASLIFSSILIENPTSDQMWISDCGFQSAQNSFVYKFNPIINRQKTRQFLTIYGSILSIEQKVNQTFLYSDQISPFKSGKYDINDRIFSEEDFELMPIYTCKGLGNMKEVNEILQMKELDTFELSSSLETLIFQTKEGAKNEASLTTFTLEQILSKHFIIANGWIKTTSSLIFQDKNQKIAEIILRGNYEMYLGKGFEHIGTMKNKITHYKTRKNSTKPQQPPKLIPTKIRMFSKQLYGLIKHQDGQAFYGNWEMNFHFKHQFLGKVVYSIDTQSNQNSLIFGKSTFFVTIYQGDQFIIGWEVEENDFLY